MSDLISRKAAIDEVKNLSVSITGLRAGKGVLNKYAEEYKKSVLRILDEAAVAYDTNKVVEQIENIMKDEKIRFADQVVQRAIKIVKGGAKDETI